MSFLHFIYKNKHDPRRDYFACNEPVKPGTTYTSHDWSRVTCPDCLDARPASLRPATSGGTSPRIIKPPKEHQRECRKCGATIAYTIPMLQTNLDGYAYKYVECPACGNHIHHNREEGRDPK